MGMLMSSEPIPDCPGSFDDDDYVLVPTPSETSILDYLHQDIIRWHIYPRLDTLSRRFLGTTCTRMRELSAIGPPLKCSAARDIPYKYIHLALQRSGGRRINKQDTARELGLHALSKIDLVYGRAKMGVTTDQKIMSKYTDDQRQKYNTLILKRQYGKAGKEEKAGVTNDGYTVRMPVDYVTVIARYCLRNPGKTMDVCSYFLPETPSHKPWSFGGVFIKDVSSALRTWQRNPQWDWSKILPYFADPIFLDPMTPVGYVPGADIYVGQARYLEYTCNRTFYPAVARRNYDYVLRWATYVPRALGCLNIIPDQSMVDLVVTTYLRDAKTKISCRDQIWLAGYLSSDYVRENAHELSVLLAPNMMSTITYLKFDRELYHMKKALTNIKYISGQTGMTVDYSTFVAIDAPEYLKAHAELAITPEDFDEILKSAYTYRHSDDVPKTIAGIAEHPKKVDKLYEAAQRHILGAVGSMRKEMIDHYLRCGIDLEHDYARMPLEDIVKQYPHMNPKDRANVCGGLSGKLTVLQRNTLIPGIYRADDLDSLLALMGGLPPAKCVYDHRNNARYLPAGSKILAWREGSFAS